MENFHGPEELNTHQMNVRMALYALENFGAEIKPYGTDKWIIEDNGIWGLVEDEGAFVVNEFELIELAEEYTEFMAE